MFCKHWWIKDTNIKQTNQVFSFSWLQVSLWFYSTTGAEAASLTRSIEGITDKGLIRKKSPDEEHFAPRCIWLRSECQTQVVQMLQQPSVRNLFIHCLCENETDVLHSALTLLLSKESMPQCFNAHTPVLTFIAPTPSRRWLLKWDHTRREDITHTTWLQTQCIRNPASCIYRFKQKWLLWSRYY